METNAQATTTAQATNYRQRNWVVLLMLSLFFFWIGADRFYMGKSGTAILKVLTFGGFGFWTLYDWFLALTNTMKDDHGNVALK